MIDSKKVCAAGAVVAMCAGAASASFTVTPQSAMSGFGSNFNGTVGTGIANSNLNVANNSGLDVEIGLKADLRFTANLPSVGNRYDAPLGTTAGPPMGATWNYVAVVDLGSGTLNDYQVNLRLDFDPAAGSSNFTTLDYNFVAFTQGGPAALNTSVFGDSQNPLFSFWSLLGAPAFDPNLPGEYEVELEVLDAAGGTVALSQIVVRVPAPASAALLAGGLVVAGRRRR